MTRRSVIGAILAVRPAKLDSWLALDLHQGSVRDEFPCTTPICFGSLLKPFLALAFSATHTQFPAISCSGSSSRCWYARGHGQQDIVSALSSSCNAYFLALAHAVDRAALDNTALTFGLATADRRTPSPNLIGLGSGWPQTPARVAHAFAALSQKSTDPAVATLLRGLRRCAQIGTARGVGFACYAKTGTAPCSHMPPAPGDGFAVAIYPPDQPRRVLLVRRHSTTGANAACELRSLAASLV